MTISPPIDWAHLLAQAAQPLPQSRLPLLLNAVHIGSLTPQDAALLAQCHPALHYTANSCTLNGDFASASAALAAMAFTLKQAGQLKAWRGELLPVMALPKAGQALAFATPLACLERAAARRLGVLTHAVHLLGFASKPPLTTPPDSLESAEMWLQERAHTKATDPGLWDTLAGGLVAADDTLHTGLLRETYEEAGLRPAQLTNLQPHGALLVQKTVPEGVMIELAWTYSATLVHGAQPQNMDGEVAQFACLAANEVRRRIAAGRVTLEAALAVGLVWGAFSAGAAPMLTGAPHA